MSVSAYNCTTTVEPLEIRFLFSFLNIQPAPIDKTNSLLLLRIRRNSLVSLLRNPVSPSISREPSERNIAKLIDDVASPQMIIRQGWLEKSAPGPFYPSIKQRWFVLNNKVGLEFYKVEPTTDAKPHGVIPLESITEARKRGAPDSGEFDVIATKRTYALKAASRAEADVWIQDIQTLIAPLLANGVYHTTGKKVDKGSSSISKGSHVDIDDADADDSSRNPEKKSNSTVVKDKDVVKSGWMSKQKPSAGGWQRRFFRLFPTTLQYYINDSANTKVQGVIHLANIRNCWYIAEVKSIEVECPDRGNNTILLFGFRTL